MKRMMRVGLLIGVVFVLALMAACNGGGSAASEGKKDDKKIVIGFSQIGAESGWRTAETKSIKEMGKNDPEIELKFSDAQQKQSNQIKAIRSFIAQKVDVIALAPVVETGWEKVLREAKRAKIPVVLLDRRIKVDDDSLYTTFIGSDFIEEGKNAAKYLANLIGPDKKVNIVELQGTVGASAMIERQKGFAEQLKKYPGYKIKKSETADFTRSKGKEVMEAFLKADGKNIDAVFAHNDDMAMGAIQAIEEYGLKSGKDIKIVSVDGIKDAFQAIKDGKSNITVECNPLLGPQLAQVAKELRDGKKVDKWIKSKEDVYEGQKAIDALPDRKY
ncbi:monosaccharide ABC transporter substrate-binding protein (CUT2 family) [Scopulibacillus darangshiensis]|uniref:Monosaccharide ABC transporter substrate-binding protein (CUT2 family) n=1 Tax=Scopulibacillus darangshiensis TaxID=442528 RepID=A0A4R2P499_9BACL|nr:ABC transporter substrate-binding protein [Scopulibacillus darangshiensis]TCP29562.1 monosaccharide ABC transporter substrate-binding protein (CUT2 family) [Scopulibacillus darangshiensis]